MFLSRTIFSILWIIPVVSVLDTAEQTCTADGVCTSTQNENDCKNEDSKCHYWAKIGECDKNPGYMKKFCRKSCNACGKNDEDDENGCRNDHDKCDAWAKMGECDMNSLYMRQFCRKSCKTCAGTPNERFASSQFPQGVDMGEIQSFVAEDGINEMDFRRKLTESRAYMKKRPVDDDIMLLCRNDHEMCTIWALQDECEKNPNYMKKNCSAACESCTYLTVEGRCPMDPDAQDAWQPGDLDKMFEKLTSEPYLSQYSVKTISSPATGGPWLITLDNVLNETEAEKLIQLGADDGYKRSSDVGKRRLDGTHESHVSQARTSTNAWCQHSCYSDETAQTVIYRLSNITGIDEPNSEYLQLLRYEPGQYYHLHHDYIPHHIKRQQGVRILTFYLYLNDVEAGGGTNFDQINATILPKRGRAVLWPSVKNEDPDNKDGRTTHQALPVEKGIKYGANAWFHMRDFKTPNRNHCN